MQLIIKIVILDNDVTNIYVYTKSKKIFIV